jgi:membrane peptidoglycan carboxypeptidase
VNLFITVLSPVLRFCRRLLFGGMKKQYQTLSKVVASTNHQYLSRNLVNTLILAEDKRYLSHLGFDPIAAVRAIFSLIVKHKLQGASTIEQQLVRTITRRYEITLSRKAREMLLASILSASFPKDKIARAYLCVAYFGWQMNGIEQACGQLSVDPETATVAQAADIVARLKYPQPSNASLKRLKQIRDRAAHILQLQREQNN